MLPEENNLYLKKLQEKLDKSYLVIINEQLDLAYERITNKVISEYKLFSDFISIMFLITCLLFLFF